MKPHKSLLLFGASALILAACGDGGSAEEADSLQEIARQERIANESTTDTEVEEVEATEAEAEEPLEVDEEDEVTSEEEPEEIEESEPEEVIEESGPSIENGEVQFGEYHAKVREFEIYEEGGNQLLDIDIDWTNQSGEDELAFFALGMFDVYQGEELLEEVSGAKSNFTSTTNYYYKADNMITAPMNLTYGLINDEPVRIRFNSTNEYVDEDSQEVIIEMN